MVSGAFLHDEWSPGPAVKIPAGETTCWLSEGTIFLEELSELKRAGSIALTPGHDRGSTNGSRAQRIARLICGSSCDLEAEVKAGKLSRGSLLSDQRRVFADSAPASTAGRYSDLDGTLSVEIRARFSAYGSQSSARRLIAYFQDVFLAGKCAESWKNTAKAIVALGGRDCGHGRLARDVMPGERWRQQWPEFLLKEAARAASRETEKELILRALTRTHWNRRRAAQDLQISYKALLYKLKQIGCSGQRAS